MSYSLSLNQDEKALLQNALINLKFTLYDDPFMEDRLDDLIYKLQTIRPKEHHYESR